jgi:superfamily II DNA or RNA helicase
MTGEPPRAGDILRIRDQRWRVERLIRHGNVSVAEVHGRDRANRGTLATFILPFEPLERLPVTRKMRIVRPRRWRRLARSLLSEAQPAYGSLRAAAAAELSVLPFQLEPALSMTRGLAARILIADEVGLGKTIQAGLIVAETLARVLAPHMLIVVPAGLRDQWRSELESRFHIRTTVADSASLSRTGSSALQGANPWMLQPVVITSIDYVKRPEVLRALETIVWDLLVFDEAHALSTRSDRHNAATALAERARTVVMLTATPHSGHDEDFARLSGIGDLGRGFPLLVFRRTRADVGLRGARRTTWLTVRPTPAEVRMHEAVLRYARQVWREKGTSSADARLAAMVLARRACSSAGSLAKSVQRRLALLAGTTPDVCQLLLPIGDSDEEPGAELGAPGLLDAQDERQQLAALLDLALAAAATESKLRVIRRLLRRIDEPVIVFTEYRDTLASLQSCLGGVASATLHGGLGRSERQDAIQDFTSGRARLLLATDAASEGLNLHQRCRLVINLELPWTPLRREQRVGRVERIGQHRRVHEIHLIAGASFEDTVLASLRRRTERIRSALAGLRSTSLDEQGIAESIFGEEPFVPAGDRPASADHVFAADLKEAAAREAERITLSRRLGDVEQSPDVRPFACATRTRTGQPCAYLAFRVAFADAESDVIWETLLACAAETSALASHSARDARDRAERLCEQVTPRLAREHGERLRDLREMLRRPHAIASERERAILAAAEQRGARMAAGLLQPTLFDRRAQRDASDQAAALGELRSRCQARLAWLTRHHHPCTSFHEPAFALIRTP